MRYIPVKQVLFIVIIIPVFITGAVVINEIGFEKDLKFVELYDGGVGETSLRDYVIFIWSEPSLQPDGYSIKNSHHTNKDGYYALATKDTKLIHGVGHDSHQKLPLSLNISRGAIALYKVDSSMVVTSPGDISNSYPSALLDAIIWQVGSSESLGNQSWPGYLIPQNTTVQITSIKESDKALTRSVCCSPLNSANFRFCSTTPGTVNALCEEPLTTDPTMGNSEFSYSTYSDSTASYTVSSSTIEEQSTTDPTIEDSGFSSSTSDSTASYAVSSSTIEAKSCGAPPDVVDGKIETWEGNLTSVNSSVTYECRPAIAKHSVTITCREDLSWSNLQPCFQDCQNSVIHNGTIASHTASTRHGTTVELACDTGFYIKHSGYMRCNNGTWLPNLPSCESVAETENLVNVTSMLTAEESQLFTIEWGKWLSWSPCTTSCGHGRRMRVKLCHPYDTNCTANPLDMGDCYTRECPVDGVWRMWGGWRNCTAVCGIATRLRTRSCDGPFYDGTPCVGSDTEREICPNTPCPGVKRRVQPISLSEGYTKSDERTSAQGVAAIAIGLLSLELFLILTLDLTLVPFRKWYIRLRDLWRKLFGPRVVNQDPVAKESFDNSLVDRGQL